MTTIFIDSSLVSTLSILSFQSRKEVVGLLFGETTTDTTLLITTIYAAKNIKRSQHRFGVSQQEVEKAIRENDNKLVGLYHSHFFHLEPSNDDLSNMKKHDLVWIIGTITTHNSITFKAYYHSYNQMFYPDIVIL